VSRLRQWLAGGPLIADGYSESAAGAVALARKLVVV